MIYDSTEWRAKRDQMLMEAIGDAHAVRFLLILFQIAETWDDLIDKDKEITDEVINRAFWLALAALPGNPFYAQYQEQITPVLAATMNAWMDSVQLEKGNRQERAVAYGLRDAYLEMVSFVILLTKGYDEMRRHSGGIRAFLMDSHETFDEYSSKGGVQ